MRHFAYQKEAAFYNGVTLEDIHGENKSDILGIGAVASAGGICGRGILLDYHAWRQKQGKAHDAFASNSIPLSDLLAVAKDQGTEIKFGDILIIRSGYMAAYNALSRSEVAAMRERQPLRFTGIQQSEEMMEWLWTNFSAAAGDHPSLECWPTQEEYALHEVLLAGWGMPIGELFDLEELGKHCAEIGRWSFFITSKPTYVRRMTSHYSLMRMWYTRLTSIQGSRWCSQSAKRDCALLKARPNTAPTNAVCPVVTHLHESAALAALLCRNDC